MMKSFLRAVALLGILFVAGQAAALPIVTLVASNTTPARGATITISWVVSGLAAGADPSVAAWDLEFDFDPSRLTVLSATYGDPVLGNQLDPIGTSPTVDFPPILDNTTGLVSLGQFATLSVEDIPFFQPTTFTLATVTFLVGSTAGPTDLLPCAPGVGLCLLGNSLGLSFPFATAPSPLVITVPEPGLAWLLAAPLLGLFVVRLAARRP